MSNSAIMTGVATGEEAAESPDLPFTISTPYTAGLWVRIDSRATLAEIFGRSIDNNQQPDPCVADGDDTAPGSGNASCESHDGPLTAFVTPFALGVWTYVASTWDGGTAGANGILKVFAGTTVSNFDQVLSYTDSLTQNSFTSKFFYFGRGRKYNGSGHSSITGRMSAGKLWAGRALTKAQLKVEMPVWNMQDTTNKFACLPMKGNFNDNSGAGNHFSNIGSIAFSADAPPITDDPIVGSYRGFFGI